MYYTWEKDQERIYNNDLNILEATYFWCLIKKHNEKPFGNNSELYLREEKTESFSK